MWGRGCDLDDEGGRGRATGARPRGAGWQASKGALLGVQLPPREIGGRGRQAGHWWAGQAGGAAMVGGAALVGGTGGTGRLVGQAGGRGNGWRGRRAGRRAGAAMVGRAGAGMVAPPPTPLPPTPASSHHYPDPSPLPPLPPALGPSHHCLQPQPRPSSLPQPRPRMHAAWRAPLGAARPQSFLTLRVWGLGCAERWCSAGLG